MLSGTRKKAGLALCAVRGEETTHYCTIQHMKRLVLCAVLILALVACGTVGVKLSDQAETMLMDTTISTLGFLIIKNNPTYREAMVDWYLGFKKLDDFNLIQKAYQEGIARLSKAVSHEPYLVMQLQSLMSMVQITSTGPKVPEELLRYTSIIDSFFKGVMPVSYNM